MAKGVIYTEPCSDLNAAAGITPVSWDINVLFGRILPGRNKKDPIVIIGDDDNKSHLGSCSIFKLISKLQKKSIYFLFFTLLNYQQSPETFLSHKMLWI